MSDLDQKDLETWATEETVESAAQMLRACCDKAIKENIYQAERAYRYASYFEGYTLTDLSGYGANVGGPLISNQEEEEVYKNDVRSLCFAFVNKSAANDSPRPQFTTKDADYEQQLKAADLDLAISSEMDMPQGQFNDIDDLVRQGVLIASSATGQFYVFSLIYENSTAVAAELDDSLTVGVYREEKYGRVKMLCRTVWLNPEIAVLRFGDEHEVAIAKNLEHQTGQFRENRKLGSDFDENRLSRRLVKVHMGWDIAAQREMFVLQDGTVLRDREYEHETPPCVSWSYKRELSGVRGTPLSHEIYNLNLLYNRQMGDVVATERKTPQVIIGVQKGTEEAGDAAKQAKDVKAVMVFETQGEPGKTISAVAAPKYSRDTLGLMSVVEQQIYDNAQIAKQHATGEKPQGTTSGVQEAMAASYYTEAHADGERRLIAMRVQGMAKLFAASIQELIDSEGVFTRMVGEKRFRKRLKGTDLDLDMGKYSLSIKAVSEQKDSPQSRTQEAKEMLQDPTVQFSGKDYLDFLHTYDVDSTANKVYGNRAWAEDQVEQWLKSSPDDMQDPEFFQPPELSMGLEGLQAVLGVVNEAFLKARNERVPILRLRFFESFLQQCLALIHEEQGRLAALQQPPPAAPPQV